MSHYFKNQNLPNNLLFNKDSFSDSSEIIPKIEETMPSPFQKKENNSDSLSAQEVKHLARSHPSSTLSNSSNSPPFPYQRNAHEVHEERKHETSPPSNFQNSGLESPMNNPECSSLKTEALGHSTLPNFYYQGTRIVAGSPPESKIFLH
jgi:hypothetical protein